MSASIESLRQPVVNSEFPPKNPEEAELEGIQIRTVFPYRTLSNPEIAALGIKTKDGGTFDVGRIEKGTGVETRRIADDISVQRLAETAASGLIQFGRENEIKRVVAITSYPSRTDRHAGQGHSGSLAIHFGLSGVNLDKNQKQSGVVDVHMACSGGAEFVEEIGDNGKVLVVASEIYSSHLAEDDTSRAIFTDEASAMIFTPNQDLTLLESEHYKYPDELSTAIMMPIDYSAIEGPARYLNIPQPLNPDGTMGKFYMDGRAVYTQMAGVAEQIKEMVRRAEVGGIDRKRIKKIIPHQASLKVLNKIRDGLGEENKDLQEKFYIDVKDGNSSSASILRGMGRLVKDRELRKDDVVMLVGFGAGLYSSLQLIKLGRKE